VTRCFACEGFEEIYVGMEVDRVGFWNGLRVYICYIWLKQISTVSRIGFVYMF